MIRLKLFVISLSLYLSSAALASDLGAAYFAILSPRFPCDAALQTFDDDLPVVVAVLWGTFGEDTSCLEKLLSRKTVQPKIIEIHLTNEACRRNRRCGETDFRSELSVEEYNKLLVSKDEGLFNSLRQRIAVIKNLASKYATNSTTFLLSPGLEDNFGGRAYESILKLLKTEWPYQIVRSPVGNLRNQEIAIADYLELHSDQPKFPDGVKCIANLDGTDMSFPHRTSNQSNRIEWEAVPAFIDTYSSRCSFTFLWSAPWQGITSEQFSKPSERSFSVDTRDVDAIRMLRKNFYTNRTKNL